MSMPVSEKEFYTDGFSISHRFGVNQSRHVIHALHSHVQYEIIYYMDGNVKYQIEGRTYDSVPGDLILIKSQTFHRILPQSDRYERIVIQLDKQFTELFDIHLFDTLEQIGNGVVGRETVKKNGLNTALLQLLEYSIVENRENTLRLFCHLILFLLDLNNAVHNIEPPKNEISNSVVNEVIDYIDAHLQEDFGLDDIAKNVFLSKFYLCHLFKEHTGLSLHSYIQTKRVLQAHNLIQTGTSAIKASMQCGFNNYSNFYKAYKKIIGESPCRTKN